MNRQKKYVHQIGRIEVLPILLFGVVGRCCVLCSVKKNNNIVERSFQGHNDCSVYGKLSRLTTLRRSFNEVKNSPKEDRRRTLGLCIGYATFTLLRKCFSVASPYMGFNKVELGTIATAYNISYGSSKFIGGILCDGSIPAEFYFACALFLASVSNIGFTISTNLSVLCMVWFFAGTAQGAGWPALGQIVMQRYEPLHIGTVWSVVITAGNLGYLIAPFLLLPFLGYGWQAPFIICGCAGLMISVMVFLLLSPDNKNNIMKALPIPPPPQKESLSQKQSSWQAWISIASNFNLWLIIFSNCLTVFVLTGLASWFSLYLIEEYKASPGRAAELMLWTEVGGLIGSLFCGSVSDRLGEYSLFYIHLSHLFTYHTMISHTNTYAHFANIITSSNSLYFVSRRLSFTECMCMCSFRWSSMFNVFDIYIDVLACVLVVSFSIDLSTTTNKQ